MPSFSEKRGIDRIIDANINRLKEGLRVCEEVARFILQDRRLTASLKKIRHQIDSLIKRADCACNLIAERNSLADVGKNIFTGELKRKGIPDIFYANIQRAKESLRVLEEFSKLKSRNLALGFKRIRYEIYEIEKKANDAIRAR